MQLWCYAAKVKVYTSPQAPLVKCKLSGKNRRRRPGVLAHTLPLTASQAAQKRTSYFKQCTAKVKVYTSPQTTLAKCKLSGKYRRRRPGVLAQESHLASIRCT
ncbi:MAG: hypothetical protein SO116_02270 [Treponema sp.]|nr:hypothetical protein [Treponema sp.]